MLSFSQVIDEVLSNRVLKEACLQRFLLEIEDLIAFLFFWEAEFDAILMK